MGEELAAVWINPYTIGKSRTGGVIARLLSLCPHEPVATRMFAPSRELVMKHCRTIDMSGTKRERKIKELTRNYIRDHWTPKKGEPEKPRVMVLLFKGEFAVDDLQRRVVGPISRGSIYGETVRDTYGDFVLDERGECRYFEPAVFVTPTRAQAKKTLKLWARYSDTDGGLLSNCCPFPPPGKPEMTLVLIKPGNFRGPSSLAGNVIDVISRTGLKIIAAKIVRMSLEQAEEFYRPVGRELADRLKPKLYREIMDSLDQAFDFEIPPSAGEKLADQLKRDYAGREFNKIITNMTGLDPVRTKSARARKAPGPEKCLALVYQGMDAVSRIRGVLGATDPTKAKMATIRRVYGHSIMDNVAHASDSRRNAHREMRIIRMEDNDFKKIIHDFYR